MYGQPIYEAGKQAAQHSAVSTPLPFFTMALAPGYAQGSGENDARRHR